MTANKDFKSMSGLAFFEKVRDGLTESPMAQLIGFKLLEVEDGRAVLQFIPTKAFDNHMGITHGGFAATVLDSALGVAAHTKLDADHAAVTIELGIKYVRAIRPENGPLLAHGKVMHAGRTLITAEGKLVDQAGKLYATATASFFATPKS